jgi:hypothetical protein
VTDKSLLTPETPLDCVELDARTFNVLSANGFKTVGDLQVIQDAQLLRLIGFGRLSLADLRSQVPYKASEVDRLAAFIDETLTGKPSKITPGAAYGTTKLSRKQIDPVHLATKILEFLRS